jgi:hypothetical protein
MSTDMHPSLMRVVYNAIQRRVFRDAIETSRRMSLPFVLAPNGTLFSRTIYDVATKRTPPEWRRRRRCSGVLNDLIDGDNDDDGEDDDDDFAMLRDEDISEELRRVAKQSLAEMLSSSTSKNGDDEKTSKETSTKKTSTKEDNKLKKTQHINTKDPIGRMLLFQESGVMLVLVVKLNTLKEESNCPSKLPYFCSKFVEQIKPEVRKLGKVVSEQYDRMKRIEEARRNKIQYIYFNRMNFALKTESMSSKRNSSQKSRLLDTSSLSSSNKSTSNGKSKDHIPSSSSELSNSLSREVLQALDGTHSSFTRFKDDDDSDFDQVREIYTKTSSDGWVVGRSAANRYFYMLLDRKSAESLEDASNLVKSANKRLFFNISN